MSLEEQDKKHVDNESNSTNSQGTEVIKVKLEKEEIAVQKRIAEKKISEIKIQLPFQLQKLFPSRLIWEIREAALALLYAVFIIIAIIVILLSILGHYELTRLRSQFGNQTKVDEQGDSVIMYCATIVPSYRGNIKEFIGIPYASLPIDNFYFYKPGPLLTFLDCFKAYWFNLKPYQKEFKDGRLTFYSSKPYPVCKQITRDRLKIIGVDSCLTISIKSPKVEQTSIFFLSQTKIDSKLPVIILLTGRAYLENRPFQVGNSIVSKAKAIFVTINFRLGVLGFSNFDTMKSPRNIGIVDFLQAMEFIYKYIDKFNGDRNNMTLLAEESGATTAIIHLLMRKDIHWFSKVWLIDGSAYIPDPPVRNLFYNMYSSPEILCSAFVVIDDVFNCLQNVTINKLLNNTPTGWLNADKYFQYLPSMFEYRESIVEKVENMILSPLEAVTKLESKIADVPIVIMSKIDYIPYFAKIISSKIIGNVTKSELFTKTRLGLLTYQTGISQVALHKEINLAYDEYIKFVENRSIFSQNVNKEVIPLGFEAVLQAIISDLRSVCPYTAIAKYLQVKAHIVQGPIYRIFDGGYRYYPSPMESDLPCDLNFFLQDEYSECNSKDKDMPPEHRDTLLKSFINFVNNGEIKSTHQMNYPLNSSMKEFEDTFTFIGRLGFRTAGVREVGLLQACNIWKKGSDELPMLKTSAKVN